jgi:hypothetical protein
MSLLLLLIRFAIGILGVISKGAVLAINILSFEILVPCIAVLYVLSEVTNNVL